MIDTIKFKATITRVLLEGILVEVAGTPAESYRSFWKRVQTPYGSFRVKINIAEMTLEVELSPMKYLMGHNLVGTNHSAPLVLGIMELVYGRFDVPFAAKDKAYYSDHDFVMFRGDFNGSFDVGSQAKVVSTMQLIREHLLAHGHDIVVHEGPEGIETIYLGKVSSRSTVKIYNKYLEMTANSSDATKALPYYSELLKYAKRLVRFEPTLRAPALKDEKMKGSKSWNHIKIREIIEGKLLDLGFSGQLSGELPSDVVASLTDDKRRKYDMWMDGILLTKYYSPETFERDHKLFLELGLDIARTRSQTQDAVLLSSRVSIEKLKTAYPSRFVEMGAILKKSG